MIYLSSFMCKGIHLYIYPEGSRKIVFICAGKKMINLTDDWSRFNSTGGVFKCFGSTQLRPQ